MGVLAEPIDVTPHNSDIHETFGIIEKGKREIELNEKHKNVILVLGNTGSGKSSFVQWLVGDNSKLISVETEEGLGDFTIEDGHRIGNSTIDSHTIFPELIIDRRSHAAYYDCPGFSDTRGMSHDIASTYFIKQLTDFATNFKIVLVISGPFVKKGVDRTHFVELITHITNFVRDIKKYKNSIAMIVTKVDYHHSVSDYRIIKSIGSFLKEVRENLVDKSKTQDISDKKQKFRHNAVNLINALLQMKNNHYTKIGLFRRPNQAGPLTANPLLENGKQYIKNILYNEIEFTKKDNDDFSYTISDKSKNDVNDLVEIINDKVHRNLTAIIQKIEKYYENLKEIVIGQINSLTSGMRNVPVRKTDAQIFVSKINTGKEIILKSKELTSIKEIVNEILDGITRLGIDTCSNNINDISIQRGYLDFLQLVSGKTLNLRSWSDLFKGTESYFYTLKVIIQEKIEDAAKKINVRINHQLEIIANEIEKRCFDKIDALEIEQTPIEISKRSQLISNFLQELTSVSNAKDLCTKINRDIINLGFGSPEIKSSTAIISYHGELLEFLKILSDGVSVPWSLEWIEHFKNTVDNFNKLEKWYKFLGSLNIIFSQYEIQRNKNNYNVANIDNWGTAGQPRGIRITKRNFVQFLEKIKQYDVEEYSSITGIEITESQLAELDSILDTTLKREFQKECPEKNKLIIKGDFIKFSDFVDNAGKIIDLCGYGVRPKSIDIWSSNTIIFDRHIRGVGDKLIISIIAPKWHIEGTRIIDLDGSVSNSFLLPAASSSSDSKKGEDGQPGLPGGAGGNFLGIGEEFINGKYLSITANGGRGGPGQSGGSGAPGNNGADAENNNNFDSEFSKEHPLINGLLNVAIKEYEYFGKPGHPGSNGGDGGMGGAGGEAGKIEIFYLNASAVSTSMIETNNFEGIKGWDGWGGPGGIGGIGGRDLTVLSMKKLFTLFSNANNIDLPLIYGKYREPKRAQSGKNGEDGGNHVGSKPREQAEQFPNIAYIVNIYKKYLRENLEDRFKKHSLMEFIRHLDDSNIEYSYDTHALISELQSIEQQFHDLHKTVDLLPFYQSLLERTNKYAQRLKSNGNSEQHKKMLSYLYTAILSKIYYMKSDPEPNLIIDIENYLNLVKENIERLTNLKESNNKLMVINQYKEKYKASIDGQIEEADYFISTQITMEMDNMSTEIADEIDLLIGEIIALEQQAEKEKNELTQKKKKLQNALVASWILGGFKIIGQIASCFRHLAAAMGSIIDSPGQIMQSIISSDPNSPEILKVPDGVISTIQSTIKNNIIVTKAQKFFNFNKLLENISAQINEHQELSDISEAIGNIKIEYQTAHNASDLNKLKELEKKLKSELIRKETSLKNQGVSVDNENFRALKVITNSRRTIELGADVGIAIYSKYKNDAKKVETIDDAIQQAKDKIQALEEHKSKLYETIIPTLKNTEDYLNDLVNQLNNKSQVVLDMTHLKIQSILKDVKLQMLKFTEGLDVGNDLIHCIEKLEETMTTLIKIYDRIQNYREQQRLATFIADISSPVNSALDITNKTLNNEVNGLEILIRSNLILDQYHTAVKALKQQVFPFAGYYVSKYELSSHLQLERNLQNLAEEVTKGVNDIQSNIEEYRKTRKICDSYISGGFFDNFHKSSKPFFVWENRKYRNEISDLLSGKEILLKSNILNDILDKDAIKFNTIGFNFYSENYTLTSELRNKLEGFSVRAIHLGNSYYRYNDVIYMITSDSLNIQFSFKEVSGEPVLRNEVYNKIKFGHPRLSPYTMWKIQLIKASNTAHFSDLKIYENKVDVELVGYGSYLTKGTNISITDIGAYYEEAEGLAGTIDYNQSELLPIANYTPITNSSPILTNLIPKKLTSRRRRHRHRREISEMVSSTSHPRPWTTRLCKGIFQILPAYCQPELSQTIDFQMPTSSLNPEYIAGHLQGGLQLLDLVIRKWTGKKYSSSESIPNFNLYDKQHKAASKLAYAAQCPIVPKFKQKFTPIEKQEAFADFHVTKGVQNPYSAFVSTATTTSLTSILTNSEFKSISAHSLASLGKQ